MSSAQIHSVFPRELSTLPPAVRRIDVREPSEFEGKLGHLPRSELVPLATLPSAAGAWPRETPLLLICRSGMRSMKAARMLAEQGFTSLSNLEGGMLAVHEAGLEVEGSGASEQVSTSQRQGTSS
ncbi:rhodanese-like domain-containing protein [Hyalangium versicolor]|uniref:rhodanese-like domain-containing protein n=1 Tax=Hyalangium versicolor TaxID=2861190 RepID=UPI001CD018BD|nr:rhodanese-like domain-containing protein [Hyalangium versicolor]